MFKVAFFEADDVILRDKTIAQARTGTGVQGKVMASFEVLS
jgi:hypothetical protein